MSETSQLTTAPDIEANHAETLKPLRLGWALLALLLSGCTQALMAPPLNWFALLTVLWVPAFWVLSRLEGRRALLAGWLIGVAANVAIFHWIIHTVYNFSNLPTPVGVLVLGLFALIWGFYAAVFGWGFSRVRRASGRWWPLAIAVWFTACEFLNPQLFTYFQGSVWYQTPSLFLITSLTGVPGVTFLMIFCNALLLQGIEASSRHHDDTSSPRALALNATVFLTLVLFALAWSHQRIERIEQAEAKADTLRVALIQPNQDEQRRQTLAEAGLHTITADLVTLSRKAMEQHENLDVIVWPEGALYWTPRHAHNQALLDLARESGAEIWTGGVLSEQTGNGRTEYFNSAFRVNSQGETDRRYNKIILLPFGEYMPLLNFFPILGRIEGPSNLTPGEELIVYDTGRLRFAFLICYEAIRPAFVRDGVRRDLDLLVNLTNDSWFGDTTEPSQHLMLAAAQAAQYGMPLLRGTSTGISAFVDARGMITAQTGVFTREVLVRDVKLISISSPYASLGDWFAWLCVLIAGLVLLRSWVKRKTD